MSQEIQAVFLVMTLRFFSLSFRIECQASTYLVSLDHFSNPIDYEGHGAAKSQNGEKQDHRHNFLSNNNQQDK